MIKRIFLFVITMIKIYWGIENKICLKRVILVASKKPLFMMYRPIIINIINNVFQVPFIISLL